MSMTIQEAIKQLDGANAMLFNRNMVAFNRAIIMAITALQEKAEREDPKPLTLEELRQMDGEPVWVVDLRPKSVNKYCVISISAPLKYQDIDHYNVAYIPGTEHDWYSFDEYGKIWIAYRHKPKEVQK